MRKIKMKQSTEELRERDSRRENLVIYQIPEAGIAVKGKKRREFGAKI